MGGWADGQMGGQTGRRADGQAGAIVRPGRRPANAGWGTSHFALSALQLSPPNPLYTFRPMTRTSLFLLLAAGLGACASGDSAPAADAAAAIMNADAPETLTYAADLKVDMTTMQKTESGLFWVDLFVGAGDSLVAGQTAMMTYTGWLPDGTKFDGNVGGTPFEFRVGAGEVIQGWDEGVIGMKPGGKRKLVVPYHLGYGEEAYGPLPARATLIFDIELLGTK